MPTRSLVLAGLATALLAPAAAAQRSDFAFGVNGHPLMQAAYSYETRHAAEQFDLLDSLGVRWYRVDVVPDSTGNVSPAFLELVQAAAHRGISILPVITSRPPVGSPVAAYAAGVRIAGGFSRRYGMWFSHIEAGNELDIWPLVSGTAGDGSSLSDYDPDTLAVVTAFLRGVTRGIRAVTPNVKTILSSGGWHHWAFFEALARDTVDYDIVGYHWYSDMGTIDQPISSDRSMLDHLYDLGKDIWMTEVGRRSTIPDDPEDQARWVAKYVHDFYRFDRVKALFIYELYEQRDFLYSSDPRERTEAFYGIVECPADPSDCRGPKRRKLAFDAYRRAVERSVELLGSAFQGLP